MVVPLKSSGCCKLASFDIHKANETALIPREIPTTSSEKERRNLITLSLDVFLSAL
jgi:hypothetical protein